LLNNGENQEIIR